MAGSNFRLGVLLLGALFLGPVALPSHAAPVDSACLPGVVTLLDQLEGPRRGPSSAIDPDCVRGTGTSGIGRAPGEYIDPVTGLVYKDTGNGLQATGVGELASYVQLNSLGGPTKLCDSSTPLVGCAASAPCADLVCQDVYVALLGCPTVTLSYVLQAVDTNDAGPDDDPAPLPDAVPVTCITSGGVTYSLVDTRIAHGFAWADCDPGDQVTVTTLLTVDAATLVMEHTSVMICGPASPIAPVLPVGTGGSVS